MKLTNTQVKLLQERLHDIINNVDANIEIINDETINDAFLRPIMRLATDMSDKIFIQTKDTINEVEI